MKELQTGAISDYLAAAAGVPHPWRASHYRIDEVAAMVHVWITRQPKPNAEKKRSWFGLGVATVQAAAEPPMAGPEMQWRHLSCMNFTCQIHTADALDERHHDLPWFGQPGLPFSNRLSRQVFACLAEGMDISAICEIFDIPFADLWKFKHALDKGQVKFEYIPAKKPGHAASDTAVQAALPTSTNSGLPDINDPVWEQFIAGELNIHIRTLSLQLILTKLRQQLSLQQNEEVKRLKLRELHRYIERNQRSLDYELQQLKPLQALKLQSQAETA